MGRDLEAATVPLHDVVVADGAFVQEAADAIEVLRSGTPGFFGLARRASETAIVIGEETAQDCGGRFQIGGAGETEFACAERDALTYWDAF